MRKILALLIFLVVILGIKTAYDVLSYQTHVNYTGIDHDGKVLTLHKE